MKALNEYISESILNPAEDGLYKYSTGGYSILIKHFKSIDDIKKIVDDAMNKEVWKKYNRFNLYVSYKEMNIGGEGDACVYPESFGHPKAFNLNAFFITQINRSENPVTELIEKYIEKYCL